MEGIERSILKFSVILFLLAFNFFQDAESFSQSYKAKFNQTKNYETVSSGTGVISSSQEVRQRREIPEAMLDPYSVLGVLSFGVYIFYILYSRYRMRGHHPAPMGNNQNQGGQLFNIDAQENFANILKMATKIISNASYMGASNSTIDSDDYFDAADSSDLRSKRKPSRK